MRAILSKLVAKTAMTARRFCYAIKAFVSTGVVAPNADEITVSMSVLTTGIADQR